VWCGLSNDVTAWAHGCLACQRGKIHRHTRLGPQPILIPQRRFSHLHVDLVGPVRYSNNYNYIFTIIYRTYKWMEAIPLSETSAAACAKALTFTWAAVLDVLWGGNRELTGRNQEVWPHAPYVMQSCTPPPGKSLCREKAPGSFLFLERAVQSPLRFPTWRGGFCMPGTGGAFTASTDEVPARQRAPPKRLDL
jgi:hypothetical protein